MKPTGLLSLKGLTSRIHPQLPLSNRETQQLRNVLNESFNKQLELKHGPVDSHQPPRRLKDDGESSAARPRKLTVAVSASQHIDRILTNPLLAPKKQDTASSLLNLARNGTPGFISTTESAVAHFRKQVAGGRGSVEKALHCLEMLRLASASYTAKMRLERTGASEAGTLILNWLWSCGCETPAFLSQQDLQFSSLLTESLVAEGKREIIEKWLLSTSTVDKDECSDSRHRRLEWKKCILESWIKTAMLLQTPITGTIEGYMRVAQSLQAIESGRSRSRRILFRAGRHLTHELIKRRSTTASDVYRKWTRDVGYWTASPQYYMALLKLHDTEPDASLALAYLKRAGSRMNGKKEDVRESERRQILSLCLDTAKVLFEQENFRDGGFVVEFATQHFGEVAAGKTRGPGGQDEAHGAMEASLGFG